MAKDYVCHGIEAIPDSNTDEMILALAEIDFRLTMATGKTNHVKREVRPFVQQPRPTSQSSRVYRKAHLRRRAQRVPRF
jgi:hypothetical protein